MKVKTLKELIKDLPDDMEVKMSIDPEGNGFRNLTAACVDYWDENYAEPVYEDDDDEFDDVSGLPEVVVLWP